MAKVITIANKKGGVGKTTTAVTLAHGLALSKKEVLVIDLDPQGNVAKVLNMDPEQCAHDMIVMGKLTKDMIRKARDNFYIVPGNEETVFAQIMLAVKEKKIDYLTQILKPFMRSGPDYVVFDTSPSVGGLQERALYAADLVVIPTATEFLSADAIADTIESIQHNVMNGWQGSALILPTFFDERTRHDKQTLVDLTGIYGSQIFAPIHRAAALSDCAGEGLTIWEYDGKSRAAEEYARLVYRIMEIA